MARRLCLLRHGIAMERDDPHAPADDADRPLTRAGEKRTLAAALGLRRLGVAPRHMLSSPLLRACQTAELAALALGFPIADIELTETLEPDADPALLVRRVSELDGEVLAVGHAPHLDRAVAQLLGRPMGLSALKKAGAAHIDLGERPPRLLWLVTPKMLRRLA